MSQMCVLGNRIEDPNTDTLNQCTRLTVRHEKAVQTMETNPEGAMQAAGQGRQAGRQAG